MMSERSSLKSGFKGELMNVIPREMLREFNTDELSKNLFLTDIGYFPKALNHFRKRPSGCKEYILIYCTEGSGCIHVKRNKYRLAPNTFFIIESNQAHYYYADKKDPWTIYWVHFSGESSKIFFDKFKALNKGSEIKIPFEKNRISEFESIIELLRLGFTRESFEYSNILLYKIIGSFIHYSLKSSKKSNSIHDALVEEIKAYLKNKITDSISIAEISEEFNRSHSTIFSIFKQKTGYSIIHYFNLLKVQTACELFNLSTMSIKEISYHLNFQDPLYFSRLFKKYMGMSPSAYKNSL